MTVSSGVARVSYPGPGVGPFSIPFKFFSFDDLAVVVRDADGGETTLTNGIGYTGTGERNASGTLTLTTALTSTDILTIVRDPAMTQTTTFRNQGAYFGSAHEEALDMMSMRLQTLEDRVNRAFRLPVSYDPDGHTVDVAPETGKVLTWQSSTRLGNSTLDSGAIAIPGDGRTVDTLTEYVLNNAVFNVLDFGATGDGVTDDTADINLAIVALNNAGGGQLSFPPGIYRVTASLTPITVPAIVQGHGTASVVRTATDGITVFTLSGSYSGIKDLAITSTITAPTSAIAVLLNAANNYLDGVQITRFYDAVASNDNAYSWFITRSHIYNSLHAGINLTYAGANADQGDCTIHATTIEQNLGTTNTAAVLYAAHGGLRIQNCKFLQHDSGVDLVLGNGAETADLLITGSSMENQAVACVRLRTAASGGSFRNIIITGNEFSALSTGKGLSVTSVAAQQIQALLIVGNRFAGASAAGSIGIDLEDVGGAIVDANSIGGFEIGIKIGADTAVAVVVGRANLYGSEVTYPVQDLRTSSTTSGIDYVDKTYRRALPLITSTSVYTNVFQVIMNDTVFHGAMIELVLDGILQNVGSFSRVVRKLLNYEGSGNVVVTAVEDVAGGQTINLQFDVATTPGSVLIGIEKPATGTGVNGFATLRCEGSVNRVVRL